MQDQAGLDGLAEADFVGKEHAGNQAPGHFGRDAELMRQQIYPSAYESANIRLPPAMLVRQRSEPDIEHPRLVELPGEQPFERAAEAEGVTEFGFLKLPSADKVVEQAPALVDRLDDAFTTRPARDGVADAKRRPPDRRIVVGHVFTCFAASRETRW